MSSQGITERENTGPNGGIVALINKSWVEGDFITDVNSSISIIFSILKVRGF